MTRKSDFFLKLETYYSIEWDSAVSIGTNPL
jgi:hypothetical protein